MVIIYLLGLYAVWTVGVIVFFMVTKPSYIIRYPVGCILAFLFLKWSDPALVDSVVYPLTYDGWCSLIAVIAIVHVIGSLFAWYIFVLTAMPIIWFVFKGGVSTGKK